jgi:DNA-binding MarR family transcriptional regulator
VAVTAPPQFEDAVAAFFRAARIARGRAAQRADQSELSLAQFHLVEPLLDGPHTLRALAEAAGVSAPTGSRMLDALVGRGYVERARDAHDRRAVNFTLTAAGRRQAAAKLARIREARARMAEALDEDERRVAADLLVRLAAVIEEL